MASVAVESHTASRVADAQHDATAPPLTTALDLALDSALETPDTSLTDTYVIPWREGLYLGTGVNAVTGMAAEMAVDKFTIVPLDPKSKRTRQFIHLCHDTDSVRQLFSDRENTRGSLNLESLINLSAGHSATALDAISHSSTSFSLVIRSHILHSSRAVYTGKDHSLTPAALDFLATSGPSEFRVKYGDYFVAGFTSMSQFSAVMTFRCKDSSQRDELQTSLNLKVGLSESHVSGDAKLTTDIKNLSKVSTQKVVVSLDVSTFGVDATKSMNVPSHLDDLKTPDVILDYLKTFEEIAAPAVAMAELRAYYMISLSDPVRGRKLQIPTTISTPSQVFTELGHIKMRLLRCAISEKALKAYPGADLALQELSDRLRRVEDVCGRQQAKIAEESKLRREIIAALDSLWTKFEQSTYVFGLYHELRRLNAVQHQPGESAQASRRVWSRGRTSAGSTAVAIVSKNFDHILAERKMLPPRVRTWREVSIADLTPESGPQLPDQKGDERVVGWTVTSRHGRGQCRTSRDDLLLSPLQRAGDMFAVSTGYVQDDEWDIVIFVARDALLDKLVSN